MMYGYHQEKILVGHQWDLKGFKITFSYQGNLDDCQCEYQNTKYGLTVETRTKSKKTCETASEKIHKGHFGPGNVGFHWKVCLPVPSGTRSLDNPKGAGCRLMAPTRPLNCSR